MSDTPCTIQAECHDDHYVLEIHFDAVSWFEQASDREILSLQSEDWAFGDASDAIALWMEDRDQQIKGMFAFIELYNSSKSRETIGFGCAVDEQGAMRWLAVHRPDLHQQILENS